MGLDSYRFSTGNEIIELPLKPDIKKIYVEVTTDCNFSCVTCIRHSWHDDFGQMSREIFDKMLADCKELPELKTIHFGGFGEPLLHPGIIDMVTACKDKGYKVELISNGSKLSGAMAGALIDAGLDWLFVSIDGPEPCSFNEIRPGGSYDEVVQNIKELQRLKSERQKLKPELGVEFVATKQNFAKLPAMKRILVELKAQQFIVTNVLPYHESMQNEILYGKLGEDLDTRDADQILMAARSAFNTQLRTQRNCGFMDKKALAITSRGDISACYAFMHNYDCYIFGRKKTMLAHSFGNIGKRTLRQIWTDPKYAVFRWTARNSNYPSCTDCRQVDGCVMAQSNEADCWGNQPSCGDCLWARELILCP